MSYETLRFLGRFKTATQPTQVAGNDLGATQVVSGGIGQVATLNRAAVLGEMA
jgi:hypothetical protein